MPTLTARLLVQLTFPSPTEANRKPHMAPLEPIALTGASIALGTAPTASAANTSPRPGTPPHDRRAIIAPRVVVRRLDFNRAALRCLALEDIGVGGNPALWDGGDEGPNAVSGAHGHPIRFAITTTRNAVAPPGVATTE